MRREEAKGLNKLRANMLFSPGTDVLQFLGLIPSMPAEYACNRLQIF
jgi:hypothetical protein